MTHSTPALYQFNGQLFSIPASETLQARCEARCLYFGLIAQRYDSLEGKKNPNRQHTFRGRTFAFSQDKLREAIREARTLYDDFLYSTPEPQSIAKAVVGRADRIRRAGQSAVANLNKAKLRVIDRHEPEQA